jgi:putative ABC transport system ATP-binding protein
LPEQRIDLGCQLVVIFLLLLRHWSRRHAFNDCREPGDPLQSQKLNYHGRHPRVVEILIGRTCPLNAPIYAARLSKSYGSLNVLKDVSLSLRAGQITTLMGPSGSGKSTLLSALAGLVRPDKGEVTLLGRSIWKSGLSDRGREEMRRLHCGLIFQQPNLMPALTAQQQLQMALEWASDIPRTDIRRRAVETLTRLGLENHLNARPHHLSGGEKQRVAVARAMAKRPKVLFADEPTAALDWERNGLAVFDMLRGAARDDGAAVLIVSHDHRLAERSDFVLHIEDGRLREN